MYRLVLFIDMHTFIKLFLYSRVSQTMEKKYLDGANEKKLFITNISFLIADA